MIIGEYYYDTRYDKPFRIIGIDGNNIEVQYIDKKNQTTNIESVQKSDFDYFVGMGAWNKYTQKFSYFKSGGVVSFADGGETNFNPDGKIKDKIVHASGEAGGMLVGKRHSNGGIKALNKSTGQPLEMEGGEVVITRNAVSDNEKRSFNGKMMTNRQILSSINESGGGVSFADGGQVPNDLQFDCNAEYEYGGKTMCGKDLAYALGGVTTAIATDPNEAMADLQSTYGYGDVYAKGGKTPYEIISESNNDLQVVKNYEPIYDEYLYITKNKKTGEYLPRQLSKNNIEDYLKSRSFTDNEIKKLMSNVKVDKSFDVSYTQGRYAKGGKTQGGKFYDLVVQKTKGGVREVVNKENMTESEANEMARDYEKSGIKYHDLTVEWALPFEKGGALNSLKKQMNDDLDIHSEYYAEGGQIKERIRLQNNKAKESAKLFKVGDSVELKPEYHNLGSIRKGKVLRVYKDDGDLKVKDDNQKRVDVLFPANYFSKTSFEKGGSTYAEGGETEIPFDDEVIVRNWFDGDRKKYKKYQKEVERKRNEPLPFAKGGEIETWKEGDEVMVLMRGTKASGYQKAIIKGIDKENGILTETDNPETLLAVYSKEEKLSDEIFARQIKSFPSSATKKEEQRNAEGGVIGKALGGIENVDDVFVEGKYPNGDEFYESQYTNNADYVVNDWLKNSRGLESYIIFARMNDGEEIEIQEFRNGGYYDKGGRTISIVNDGVKYDKSKYKAVYGDFDKDGVVNIDDANPLNKNKKGKVEEIELKNTFDKLLGVKAELDTIMYDAVDTLDKKAPKGADIYARTKTPYSILKKLVEKRMLDPQKGLTDMIGTTIAVDNHKQLEKVRDDIDGGLLGKVLDRDDFYKTPNAGYRAYHYIVEYKGVPVEVQLKTKNMKKLHQVGHSAYKNGNLDAKQLNDISVIFMKADKGDSKSKKEMNKLLKNKELLKSKVTKSSMAKGGKTKSSGAKRKTPMSLAKEIRKEGEKWQDAVKRASAIIKKEAK